MPKNLIKSFYKKKNGLSSWFVHEDFFLPFENSGRILVQICCVEVCKLYQCCGSCFSYPSSSRYEDELRITNQRRP
jgi:phage gp36-like protein